MPFSGAADPKLPTNVQSLSKAEREKWASTWNSVFAGCRKDNNTVARCESTAFRIANGNITKEAAVKEEIKDASTEPTEAEKLHSASDVGIVPVVVVEEPFQAFGGATSFDEADEFKNAQEQARAIDTVTWETGQLINNAMNSDDVENRPNLITRIATDMRGRLSDALASVKEKVVPGNEPAAKAFQIFASKDGGPMRWLGIPSNKFRDRDYPAQIISEAAHKEFVAYLDATKNFPVLEGWHTPGSEIGRADFAAVLDGFLIVSGTIDQGKEKEAERLAEKCRTEDIGMSHGFVYTFEDEKNQVIGWYRMHEVSHLPVERAANVWTTIDILTKKEVVEMPLDPKKREYLVGVMGEDKVAAMETGVSTLAKNLALAGIEYKDVAPEPVAEPAAEAAPAVEPETTTPAANEAILPEGADIVKEAVTAIVDHPAFKGLVEAVGTLTEEVAALKGTTAEAVEVAKKAVETAELTVDEIVSQSMIPKSLAYQASKSGPPVEADEKDALGGPEAEKTGMEKGMMEFVLGNAEATPV